MMNKARRQVLGALIGLGLAAQATHNTYAATEAPQKVLTRRHALVIGNARYAIPGNALINPVNDANLVAKSLRSRGFDVTVLTDLTTRQMEAAVDVFANQAENAELALVYFAGHAVALEHVNYLFGVELSLPLRDVRIDNTQQHSLSMRRVSQALRRAKIQNRLVVLDACRTNLTRGSTTEGLTHTIPAGGELIAFSTQPGATAEDGFGANGPRHSPYAFYFAHALDTLPEDTTVETFFKQLTADVQVATAYRQVPHYASSLVGETSFVSMTDARTTAMPGATSSGSAQPGRGPSPALGQDLIRARMSEWEQEIERGAQFVDEPRYEALRARAEVGDVVAITTLGLIAENGQYAEQDYKLAIRWYQRAADQSFAPAQTYLGELIAMGRGTPKNYAVAERLFNSAAQAGHRRAALDLFDIRTRMGQVADPQAGVEIILETLKNLGMQRLP